MQVISTQMPYASVLRRAVALLIDSILLGAVADTVFWAFGWGDGVFRTLYQYGPGYLMHFDYHDGMKYLVYLIYFALMESSSYQGTLGKIVMGIRVVDKEGRRIELPKAVLRTVCKYISSLIAGIGYLIAVFDSRKQTLHDKLADTFVVRA